MRSRSATGDPEGFGRTQDRVRARVSTDSARSSGLHGGRDRDRVEGGRNGTNGHASTPTVRPARARSRSTLSHHENAALLHAFDLGRKTRENTIRRQDLRSFGKATLSEDRKTWLIACEPQIRILLKRIFKRIEPDGSLIKLSNTEENCRDFEWFRERYWIDVDDSDELFSKARAYDDRRIRCAQIFDGIGIPQFDLARPPRDYQRVAAAMAITSGGLLIADDLGLGKTITGICILSAVGRLPALVVCPVHIQRQWRAKLAEFAPNIVSHIVKTMTPYTPKKTNDGRAPDVLIISYAKLAGWATTLLHSIKTILYDEVQELRHIYTEKYVAASALSEVTEVRAGLSATPIANYGIEWFNVLSILRPGDLGTLSEFKREWCTGEEKKATITDTKAFGAHLRETAMMIRRTRTEVAREIPKVSQILHQIDIDAVHLQKVESSATELARVILKQNRTGIEAMRASSEFSNQLRLATGVAKAGPVAAFVDMLLETGESVVLWGWHHAVYAIWREKLGRHMPSWYTGAESPAAKDRELQRFIRGDTKLLIMSLRSGAGIDGLQHACATGVFGELDWSPGAMDQCGARIARDEQQRPVTLYFPVANDGCDPYMIDVLGLKREQMEGVRDPNLELVESLEIDPNHIRKLAEDYLARRGVTR